MDAKPSQADLRREYRRAHSNPDRPFQFTLRSLLLSVMCVGLAIVAGKGCLGIARDVEPLRFESVNWKRAAPIERHRTVRSQMIDDLLRRGLLNGLTRPEVESMLGPPEPHDLVSLGVDPYRWDIAYYLGLERGGVWSLDSEFLAIRFGDAGHVVECRNVVN